MKNYFNQALLGLCSLTLLAVPATAAEMNHAAAPAHPAAAAPHAMGPDMMQHGQEMEQMMKNAMLSSQRSLDMLAMGNGLIEMGSQKKDGKMMSSGAQLAMHGLMMHMHSMMGLKKMSEGIKDHLMHAKVGDMQIPEKDMAAMQASMAMLKKEMDGAMAVCKPEMAKMSANANKLVSFGNEMMLKAKAAKDADMMLMGHEHMMMGMKLQMMMQGMHEQMMSGMPGMQGNQMMMHMHSMMGPMSGEMGMMHEGMGDMHHGMVQEEIEIIRH